MEKNWRPYDQKITRKTVMNSSIGAKTIVLFLMPLACRRCRRGCEVPLMGLLRLLRFLRLMLSRRVMDGRMV